MTKIITAGNKDNEVRSDCFVTLESSDEKLSVVINSKVKALYGKAIDTLAREMLAFYGIRKGRLEIDDRGALPFTLAARLEAVMRKQTGSSREYLLPLNPRNHQESTGDRERVSRLYLPGNNPKLMINAGIYGCHGIILDLEDSVAPDRKYEARFLVRNALRSVDFYGAERMVRINQLPAGLADLGFVVPQPVNLILIPKCENAGQVRQVDTAISEILGRRNEKIHLMPIIESAAGVMNSTEIAKASERVVALAIGLEDYTADLGVQRTPEGNESFFARSMVVNAARAAGIQAIDSVFSDIDDTEALLRSAAASKSLGFCGMGCIHPRQIRFIHQAFLPGDEEIERASRIVEAYERAEKEGLGVVALGSKMIDPPVVKRALQVMEKARKAGILFKEGRASNEQ